MATVPEEQQRVHGEIGIPMRYLFSKNRIMISSRTTGLIDETYIIVFVWNFNFVFERLKNARLLLCHSNDLYRMTRYNIHDLD